MKIIEPYNLLSTVLTVALWLGGDDYDTVKKCAGAVFDQLKELKTIKHPLSGKEIKIVRRSCGDGKERRSSTGNSSAKSSYPISEAPVSQLGGMKIVCTCPVWSVEDTEALETKFQSELKGKALAKKNTGSSLSKILEILAVVIFLEHHFLSTTLELPILVFDLQKHYVCELPRLHQACIHSNTSKR